MILARLAVVGLLVVSTRTAVAGRTHFAWLYGTDIVPERGTEVETWILEENGEGDAKEHETAFWWGPVMALTPHLELSISIEAEYKNDRMGNAGPQFTRWGGEFRYRLQSPDAVDAGPVATKFRAGVKRPIVERAAYQLEADVINSYQQGRLFALVDVGFVTERSPLASETQIRPGAGISLRATKELRFGVESYGELIVEGDGTSWYVVGPTISLTSGRFWGAATYGVGVLGIRSAPRVTFGLAL
ncbi:MAG: hypothetical protein H0V17_02160 [Deltaproteobacteria bacterium]|nr:hypothetical protein [Deltaproteobacteria bacterium]